MSASALEGLERSVAAAGRGAAPRPLRLRRPRFGRFAIRAGALALCLLAWQLAATMKLDFGFVTFRNVPTPGEGAQAF
jgi:NitT/TauT family transport system permease protein